MDKSLSIIPHGFKSGSTYQFLYLFSFAYDDKNNLVTDLPVEHLVNGEKQSSDRTIVKEPYNSGLAYIGIDTKSYDIAIPEGTAFGDIAFNWDETYSYAENVYNEPGLYEIAIVYDRTEKLIKSIYLYELYEYKNYAWLFTIRMDGDKFVYCDLEAPFYVDGVLFDGGSSVEIVQGTGESTTAVMSQKAVTEALDAKAEKIDVVGKNLYNYREATEGYYFNVSNGQMVANTGNCVAYVKLDGSGQYITKVNTNTFGFVMAAQLPIFDKDKKYIGYAQGTLTEGTETQKDAAELLVNIDLEGAYYVGFTARSTIKTTIMFVKGDAYPTKYLPYEKNVHIPSLKVDVSQTTGIVKKKSNLYDPNAEDVQVGAYIMYNGTIGTGSGYLISGKIPVKPNTTYLVTKSPTVSVGVLGGQYTEDGEFLSPIRGTLSDDGVYCTFTTVANANLSYICVNFDKNTSPTGMLIEGDTYPPEYISHGQTL
jgi:hypothetical protein